MGSLKLVFNFNTFRATGAGFFVSIFILLTMFLDGFTYYLKNPAFFHSFFVIFISAGLVNYWLNPAIEFNSEGLAVNRLWVFKQKYSWAEIDVLIRKRKFNFMGFEIDSRPFNIQGEFIRLKVSDKSWLEENIYISGEISNYDEVKECLENKGFK